jgi:hypothetical protein
MAQLTRHLDAVDRLLGVALPKGFARLFVTPEDDARLARARKRLARSSRGTDWQVAKRRSRKGKKRS